MGRNAIKLSCSQGVVFLGLMHLGIVFLVVLCSCSGIVLYSFQFKPMEFPVLCSNIQFAYLVYGFSISCTWDVNLSMLIKSYVLHSCLILSLFISDVKIICCYKWTQFQLLSFWKNAVWSISLTLLTFRTFHDIINIKHLSVFVVVKQLWFNKF